MVNDGEERDVSAFNEGMLQIQRLNYLWTQTASLSRSGNLKKWRWTLDAVWRELSRDAIKDASDNFDPEQFDKVSKDNPWFMKQAEIVGAISKSLTIAGQYRALERYEIFLKFLQEAVGKGGKYIDRNEDDID